MFLLPKTNTKSHPRLSAALSKWVVAGCCTGVLGVSGPIYFWNFKVTTNKRLEHDNETVQVQDKRSPE